MLSFSLVFWLRPLQGCCIKGKKKASPQKWCLEVYKPDLQCENLVYFVQCKMLIWHSICFKVSFCYRIVAYLSEAICHFFQCLQVVNVLQNSEQQNCVLSGIHVSAWQKKYGLTSKYFCKLEVHNQDTHSPFLLGLAESNLMVMMVIITNWASKCSVIYLIFQLYSI